jgi:hypothetical protein
VVRALLVLSLVMTLSASAATFTILDENVDEVLAAITSGEGTPSKSNDAFSGSESLFVGSTGGDGQNFNPAMPGWSFGITENPVGDNEFRYISFAWKKDGGEGLQLQLHGDPDTWGHRYHGGANVKNWNPSIQAQEDIPTVWTRHVRDLYEDWGEFTLTGIAYSSWDGVGGFYDDIALHQELSTTAVEAKDRAMTMWATLKAR